MVTGRGGIKSLEGKAPAIVGNLPLVGSWLHVPQPGDLEMLIQGNAFLFPYNMHNWYRLREKPLHGHGNVYPVRIPGLESSWGVELERALVVLEQSLVQQWLDTYRWASAESKAASLRRISKGFGGPFTNAWLKEALDKSVGVASFDFGNLDHRISLGFEAVRRLRGEGL